MKNKDDDYLNTNGRFKRGNPGRKKGSKNKESPKKNFQNAFTKLGGVEGLVAWAKKSNRNRSAFYQLYSKMLPSAVGIDDEDGNMDTTLLVKFTRTPAAPKEDIVPEDGESLQ